MLSAHVRIKLERPPVGVKVLKEGWAGVAPCHWIGAPKLEKGLRSKRTNGCRQQLSSVVLVDADTVVQASNWQTVQSRKRCSQLDVMLRHGV